jgi:hypothetical protein
MHLTPGWRTKSPKHGLLAPLFRDAVSDWLSCGQRLCLSIDSVVNGSKGVEWSSL